MKLNIIILLAFFSWSIAAEEIGPNVVVSISLLPAGGFEAKSSRLKGGRIYKKGSLFTVNNVYVPVGSLTTDISLRDKHLHKYLNSKDIIVNHAEGSAGKGKGQIQVNGVTRDFIFTYKELDEKLVESQFSLKLSDFKYEEIKFMSIKVNDVVHIKVVAEYEVVSLQK